jgi:hypothetical protein
LDILVGGGSAGLLSGSNQGIFGHSAVSALSSRA